MGQKRRHIAESALLYQRVRAISLEDATITVDWMTYTRPSNVSVNKHVAELRRVIGQSQKLNEHYCADSIFHTHTETT